MNRWICPTCGSGTNAPSRPRRDDARRYCLACTAKTGRLVERTCPALDRQRAERSTAQAARRSTLAERTKAAETQKWTVGGYDLRKEAKRLWNLPTVRALDYGADRGRPVPQIALKHRTGYYTTGRASPRSGVTMTVGTDVGYALEVLLHELLHCALGQDEQARWHTPAFWTSLRSAMKEAWPQVDFQMQDSPQRGYAIDRYLASSLTRWIEEGKN
jgi:hypothetical protein